MLIYTAKPKLTFGELLVSVPNKLIKPRMTIAIQDDRLKYANNRALLVENNSVTYDFDANGGSVGINFCGINPTGLYDYRCHYFRKASNIFKCVPRINV